MGNVTDSAFSRGIIQANILKSMAAAAPAFGMIGTLVGLIVMLQGLGADFSSLGSGLAVALITTLYGVLLAQLVFKPAASKVEQREQIRRFRNTLIAEGLALLAERRPPRYIQDMMNSYLDPSIHFDIDQQQRALQAGE